MFKKNVGTIDRVARIVVGVSLVAYAIINEAPWGFIGIIPILTGSFATCPAYLPFGFSTCKLDKSTTSRT